MIEKYIELADRMKRGHGDDEVLEGIDYALHWLDEHPDQVPGRTITESELLGVNEWLPDTAQIGPIERRDVAEFFGITVVPDPEPTNAELIERKLRELREEPGEWMTYATDSDLCGFARALDAKGVKAPGGDE